MNDFSVEQMAVMGMAMRIGVTPEQYADFFNNQGRYKEILTDIGIIEPEGEEDDYCHEEMEGAEWASDKTLRLRIKMKNVSKPPMWREVLVPADFNFTQLHYIIQAVMGLDNSHLWQFQKSIYRQGPIIGVPIRDGYGLDELDIDSDHCPLTMIFNAKKAKMEYVYDFRVDWKFEITLEDIVEREGEVAECTKWKGDLQATERIAGSDSYEDYRDCIERFHSLSANKQRDIAGNFGFSRPMSFEGWIDEQYIDIEFINEELSEIPDSWEDFD